MTKLFGVNYDTPIGAEPIRTSNSQLSQPGSYMLAPSYSEALLMEPAARPIAENRQNDTEPGTESEIDMGIVPSYSEALLYERAELGSNVAGTYPTIRQDRKELRVEIEPTCQCLCHKISNGFEIVQERNLSDRPEDQDSAYVTSDSAFIAASSSMCQNDISNELELVPCSCGQQGSYACCPSVLDRNNLDEINVNNNVVTMDRTEKVVRPSRRVKRDVSEPNLRSRSEIDQDGASSSKINCKSLENILEEETTDTRNNIARIKLDQTRDHFEGATIVDDVTSITTNKSFDNDFNREANGAGESKGAIPKRFIERTTSRCRVTVNPRSDEVRRQIPISRTYFCLKSILKQNKRRYTLMTTAQELEHIEDWETVRLDRSFEELRYAGTNLERGWRNNEIVGSNGEEKAPVRTCLSRENLSNASGSRTKDKGHLQNSTIGKERSSPTEQKYDYSRSTLRIPSSLP